MNDRFNKDFSSIFGEAQTDPFPGGQHCISPRGAMFPNAKKAYPGSVGAQTPVAAGGMVRGKEPLIVKSGHTSITRSCLRHNGQP